jgi:hypothetical protein
VQQAQQMAQQMGIVAPSMDMVIQQLAAAPAPKPIF